MPFRPSALVCTKKPSSSVWLARQARDPYVRLRSSPNASVAAPSYRSRSAFKLLEMNEKWHFLDHRDVQVVLDLGSAPGGWSQVVAQKLGWDNNARPPRMSERRTPYPEAGTNWSSKPEDFDPLDISDLEASGGTSGALGRGTIIAVDRLHMSPITGVQFIQADFLEADTEVLLRSLIAHQAGPAGKADVILCDMAGNATGNAFHDIEDSLAICDSVFEFTKRHIRSAESVGRIMGGALLIKHFVHPLLYIFRKKHLEPNFNDVRYIKPNASRTESKEGYFLCRGWKGL
ncbi:ribosomal RNA large subunit methyltransferase J [Mycena metata]|uniref:rRNA methyltransferase 2, mitochondrial n=1 Tax=Mycena metata TaxID=1033252 RepID=A0AAD7IUL8_9AGAR|nr:ribosomal RNA large subunit methyltransferase J [Mycena metata]